jgi:hypothetical protein
VNVKDEMPTGKALVGLGVAGEVARALDVEELTGLAGADGEGEDQ